MASRTSLGLHAMQELYWCNMAMLGEPCHEPHQWLSPPSGLTNILATIPCPSQATLLYPIQTATPI